MDEFVSLLGAHYTLFEKWGAVLLAAQLVIGAACTWWALKTGQLRRRLAAILGVAATLAGLGVTLFVNRNITPPTRPPGYEQRAVTFPGPGGTLGGDMLVPVAAGPHPALMLLVGSDISSYRTNYSRLVNELVTPIAASLQFVVLYFDKRGVGRSTGDWTSAGIEDRAADARAALRYLTAHPSVDPNGVVVIGHSQGGWVAQLLAAAEPSLALAISLAGPTVSATEQIFDDERGRRLCDGASADVADAQAGALIAELYRQSQSNRPGRIRHFAAIAKFRPDTALRSLRAPTALVFGENDRLVPADRNIARLRDLWGDMPPANVEIVAIPGAGHSLRLVDRCHSGSEREAHYSPIVEQRLRGLLASAASTRASTQGAAPHR